MHPDILIVHKYRQSYVLFIIPDDLNTLTLKSANKNDTPRDPPSWPCYKRINLFNYLLSTQDVSPYLAIDWKSSPKYLATK